MTLSASALGDQLGDSLGDKLGDSFGDGTAAQRILGDSWSLEYNPGIFTLGAGGIAAIANQQGNSDFDVTQSTTSLQPDVVTTEGHPAMGVTSAGGEFLESITTGTTAVATDQLAYFMVLKPTVVGVTTGFGGVVETSGVTGILMYQDANLFIGRCLCTAGTAILGLSLTTTDMIVARFEIRADRFHLTVNGVQTETVAVRGGVANDLKTARLGRTYVQTPFDGSILYATLAVNPTADQSDDYLAFLEDTYL